MEFVRGSSLLVTLVSAGVCAALIFGLTLLSAGTQRRADASISPATATVTAPALPARSGSTTGEFVLAERPLFHQSRRPYAGNEMMETSFAPEPTNTAHLQLKGVLKRGGTARAYVELIGGGEPVWLKTGETVAGWTLKQVSDDGVVLSDGARNISLKLYPQADR